MKGHEGVITHENMMAKLEEIFTPVFESSPDGVYLWLDEQHMICNKKLAKMFGYSTPQELCKKSPFLENFVAEDSQEAFSMHYHKHVAQLSRPATFRFKAKRKDGSTFAAETDMVPISFSGHPVAYHFVREIKK